MRAAKFDYHVHESFSSDATHSTVESYIKAAETRGIEEVAFGETFRLSRVMVLHSEWPSRMVQRARPWSVVVAYYIHFQPAQISRSAPVVVHAVSKVDDPVCAAFGDTRTQRGMSVARGGIDVVMHGRVAKTITQGRRHRVLTFFVQ